MLMEPHESQEEAVVGGSTHGSGVYSSDLRSLDPGAHRFEQGASLLATFGSLAATRQTFRVWAMMRGVCS